MGGDPADGDVVVSHEHPSANLHGSDGKALAGELSADAPHLFFDRLS